MRQSLPPGKMTTMGNPVSSSLTLTVYISDHLAPGEIVSFVPKFVWHGFRFVEVSSNSIQSIHRIEGLVLRTDVENVGHFEVS